MPIGKVANSVGAYAGTSNCNTQIGNVTSKGNGCKWPVRHPTLHLLIHTTLSLRTYAAHK